MTNLQPSKLYWDGGPFRVRLYPNPGTPQHAVDTAISILEEFRTDCQKQYIAFNGVVNGRQLAYERFRPLMKSKDKRFFVGTAFPEVGQSPGKSTIAQMSQGEFLEGLKEGGEFENQHAKALIVLMYHRWDENFRKRIANVMSVPQRQVECCLMGDIRLVRNLIIHKNSIVPHNFSTRLELLPEIWSLEPGELTITEKMVHSLMEQINAIWVRITPDV